MDWKQRPRGGEGHMLGWGRAYAGMHEGHALKISDFSPNQTRPSNTFFAQQGVGQIITL